MPNLESISGREGVEKCDSERIAWFVLDRMYCSAIYSLIRHVTYAKVALCGTEKSVRYPRATRDADSMARMSSADLILPY